MNLLYLYESITEKKYVLILCFCICVFFQSVAIPPFQSPDETSHYTKAYSTLHFEAPSSTVSIYKTLSDIMEEYSKFAFNYNHKLTSEIEAKVNTLQWDKRLGKIDVPNPVGSYMPLVYIPSAVGILVGKTFGCTVKSTYYISRVINMLISMLILTYAFYLVRPNLLTLAMLFTPMTMFQYASTSPDSISFSLVILIFSLFSKIKESQSFCNLDFWVLCISLIAFIGHRQNFLPLIFLPLALYIYKNNIKKAFLSLIVIGTPFIVWIVLCKIYLGNATLTRSGFPMSEIMQFYIYHPLKIAELLCKTLTSNFYLNFYNKSLIGNLGWLDYSISETAINILTYLLIISFILHLKVKNYGKFDFLVIALIMISFFMIFGALLVQWSDFPNPEYIDGVQGRYFIPIILALSYLINKNQTSNRIIKIISSTILIYYIGYSNYSMIIASIYRYFVM